MKLTFYGHGTHLIEADGKKILFDPFFTGNPAAKEVDLDNITADYIFVTHGHGDHTTDLVSIARKTGALCVASAEIANWLGKKGGEKLHGMNHGGPILIAWLLFEVLTKRQRLILLQAVKNCYCRLLGKRLICNFSPPPDCCLFAKALISIAHILYTIESGFVTKLFYAY